MHLFCSSYLSKKNEAAPLAVFRILFGLMMLVAVIRFWSNGWIEKYYIEPTFFFSYYGFEWVKPLGEYTYLLFIVCALSAFGVALGFYYRISIITFFLSFTYIELMDKTMYLNHYYFISVLSFLMIFLPAGDYFSWDAQKKSFNFVPKWSVDSIKLLLGIVYLYAGIAKLNSDWLLKAMPLKIWLTGEYDIPLLGDVLRWEWVIYVFSWGGALYDLSIPFLLLWKRTRLVAFVFVILFHMLTHILFPIGMFPYIMIISTLIFFDSKTHEKIIFFIHRIFKIPKMIPMETVRREIKTPEWKLYLLSIFFAIELLLPWRYLLYPGELFWTEEGFRFSWRVMLMEKAGHANFKIVDQINNEIFYINNSDFLTSFQEKQMATQADFILMYAHYLRDYFLEQGKNVEVYVESYVALNGRKSQPYIDPSVDLTKLDESFKCKNWILPFKDEIKGI